MYMLRAQINALIMTLLEHQSASNLIGPKRFRHLDKKSLIRNAYSNTLEEPILMGLPDLVSSDKVNILVGNDSMYTMFTLLDIFNVSTNSLVKPLCGSLKQSVDLIKKGSARVYNASSIVDDFKIEMPHLDEDILSSQIISGLFGKNCDTYAAMSTMLAESMSRFNIPKKSRSELSRIYRNGIVRTSKIKALCRDSTYIDGDKTRSTNTELFSTMGFHSISKIRGRYFLSLSSKQIGVLGWPKDSIFIITLSNFQINNLQRVIGLNYNMMRATIFTQKNLSNMRIRNGKLEIGRGFDTRILRLYQMVSSLVFDRTRQGKCPVELPKRLKSLYVSALINYEPPDYPLKARHPNPEIERRNKEYRNQQSISHAKAAISGISSSSYLRALKDIKRYMQENLEPTEVIEMGTLWVCFPPCTVNHALLHEKVVKAFSKPDASTYERLIEQERIMMDTNTDMRSFMPSSDQSSLDFKAADVFSTQDVFFIRLVNFGLSLTTFKVLITKRKRTDVPEERIAHSIKVSKELNLFPPFEQMSQFQKEWLGKTLCAETYAPMTSSDFREYVSIRDYFPFQEHFTDAPERYESQTAIGAKLDEYSVSRCPVGIASVKYFRDGQNNDGYSLRQLRDAALSGEKLGLDQIWYLSAKSENTKFHNFGSHLVGDFVPNSKITFTMTDKLSNRFFARSPGTLKDILDTSVRGTATSDHFSKAFLSTFELNMSTVVSYFREIQQGIPAQVEDAVLSHVTDEIPFKCQWGIWALSCKEVFSRPEEHLNRQSEAYKIITSNVYVD